MVPQSPLEWALMIVMIAVFVGFSSAVIFG
jgi:hypothetical protein